MSVKFLEKLSIFLVLTYFLGFLTACDPYRKKECEWYLVPEPDHQHHAEKGWVALCARNFTLGREKCYLQAPFDLAEKIYGKTLRFSDIDFSGSLPQKIKSVKLCTPDKKPEQLEDESGDQPADQPEAKP